MHGFVLIGGWPGSGKTTLAAQLSEELQIARLSKDEVKEALMDAFGAPDSVQRSLVLGRASVLAVLRAARGCPAAVIDSTWFDYTPPLVGELPGRKVEVRCVVPKAVARERYRKRVRDPRYLDDARDEAELWKEPVAPLGVGPLVEVDTSEPVDIPRLGNTLRELLQESATPPEQPAPGSAPGAPPASPRPR